MYRAKTVRAMQLEHRRREKELLAVIREMASRLAHLSGRPWDLSPADIAPELADEPEEPSEDPDYPGMTSDPDLVGF